MNLAKRPIRVAGIAMALAAAALLSGPTAVASQTSPQRPGGEYPRHFGYITMQDGVRLAYVYYLPRAKGRFPALLQYEPYLGGGSVVGWPARLWLENGYAVVFASVRGTGCSQGVFDLFGPDEGPDGAAIIDWIGTQSWSDRRVGMIGVYPGGILNVGFGAEWSLHVQPAVEAKGVKARIAWGDEECARNYSAHPVSRLFAEALAHPLLDTWWRTRSLASYVDRVRVPTFLSGTWQDNQTLASGTTELYERLQGPKRLSMSPGGHTWAYAEAALQQDLVRWMNRWVKGVPNGIEAEPPVTIYWEPSGWPPTASWTTHYSGWPPKRAVQRTFWLTWARTLSDSPPGGSPADAKGLSYTFPTGVELVGNNTQFAVPPDPNGSLAWTSAPLGRDLTILGRVRVRLYAASQSRDTDFVVALHDVYPNGGIEYLQRGFLRASLRAVDEDSSTPDHVAHTYGKPDDLVPGRVYEFQLSLPPLGAVLRKGHRLQVVLLAPSPIPQPDWGLLPVDLPGENTVYADARHLSAIVVPFLPGADAEGPEPACGSLGFQPCRKPGQHD